MKNKHNYFFNFLSKNNGNKFVFNNNISAIIGKNEKLIYTKKLENITYGQTNYYKSQKDLLKIDYLSIIITGKSGVGKSTVNSLLIKRRSS